MTKRRLADAAGFLIVIAATLWVYLPTLSIPLWGDDAWHVYELRDPARAIRLLYDPAVALDVNSVWFRPVGDLSYTLDYQLWGLGAAGYHAHGLLLHCLVVVMLAWLLRDWLDGRPTMRRVDPATTWLIALAFSLNPIAAQVVTRPSMRYDLYATLLALIALLSFRRWQRGVWRWGRALSLAAAFGAFASKDIAGAIPALVFVLSEDGLRRRLRALWPFAIASLLYLVWRVSMVKGLGGYVWTEWSWLALANPASYLNAAMAMAQAGWGTPWALGALLVAPVTRPRLGLLTNMAFFATLAPLILPGNYVASLHYFYLPLAIFLLALGTGLAALGQWKAGRFIALFCLVGLTGQGFRDVPPVLAAEARLAQDRLAAATSLTRLPRSPAGVTYYFLYEGFLEHSYLRILAALLTNTTKEAWRVLNPDAALNSPGLAEKAEAGAARIFRYDGTGWKDNTMETVNAIRGAMAATKAPPPTLTVTPHGYRVRVQIEAGMQRGLHRLYFTREGESGIYEGFLRVYPEAVFSIPEGRYVLTATYMTPQGESVRAAEVHLTIPARGP